MTIVDDDPYLWLEDITCEQALDWVRQYSETTLAELSGERFERMRAEALEVADSSDRIPGVKRRGEYLYNFWTDAEHPRGLWRRTTLEEYCRDSPDGHVIIDIDALAAAEDENWVWAGADVIEPEYTRADLSVAGRLGRGGRPRIRHGCKEVFRRRFQPAGCEVRCQLGGRETSGPTR